MVKNSGPLQWEHLRRIVQLRVAAGVVSHPPGGHRIGHIWNCENFSDVVGLFAAMTAAGRSDINEYFWHVKGIRRFVRMLYEEAQNERADV